MPQPFAGYPDTALHASEVYQRKLAGNAVNHSQDFTAPMNVTVELDTKRNVLYVHINGVTALRVCRAKDVTIKWDETVIPSRMKE